MLSNEQSVLASDYAYCEAIIKQHSNSFYQAFSALPQEKAQAVYAIYAFCRTADNCVDENETIAAKTVALNEMVDSLNRFAFNQEDDHPLWRALRDVFNRYEMDILPFYDQLTGQLMDIHFIQPDTMESMEAYSYYVAGSVGRMLLPIIASEAKEDCTKVAVSLGIGMQITNILRDVGEDYMKLGRIYLPRQEMQLADYTPAHIANYEVTEGFKVLWERMASRAEALYDEFLDKVDLFDQDSRFAVMSSALIYRAILTSVRQNGYDCLRRRNYVSTHQMIQILSEATG